MLEKSGLKYGILRLGSVYGKAENEKRMFNLPNLFPLRTKKNLDLKLFSKGVQIKSIVSVADVADAMIFLSKRKDNGLYHFVSQHLTVLEIAQICKSYNPKINLILTNDKIPYKGYFINSRKIKSLGFRYNYFYQDFVKDFLVN